MNKIIKVNNLHKITKVNNLHAYLKNELDNELINRYPHFKIISNFYSEEGCYILIENNENIKKIIGIIPVNSDSIYSNNETFKIKDFTNETTHIIHEILIIPKEKKPVIVCDEQGGILCCHTDHTKSGFISKIIKKENLTKSFILDNYVIDYDSFYNVAKNKDVNDVYNDFTDENKIMDFIINLF